MGQSLTHPSENGDNDWRGKLKEKQCSFCGNSEDQPSDPLPINTFRKASLKYVEIDHTTDLNHMMKFMESRWYLTIPKFVICIDGCFKEASELAVDTIIRLAQVTGAWILPCSMERDSDEFMENVIWKSKKEKLSNGEPIVVVRITHLGSYGRDDSTNETGSDDIPHIDRSSCQTHHIMLDDNKDINEDQIDEKFKQELIKNISASVIKVMLKENKLSFSLLGNAADQDPIGMQDSASSSQAHSSIDERQEQKKTAPSTASQTSLQYTCDETETIGTSEILYFLQKAGCKIATLLEMAVRFNMLDFAMDKILSKVEGADFASACEIKIMDNAILMDNVEVAKKLLSGESFPKDSRCILCHKEYTARKWAIALLERAINMDRVEMVEMLLDRKSWRDILNDEKSEAFYPAMVMFADEYFVDLGNTEEFKIVGYWIKDYHKDLVKILFLWSILVNSPGISKCLWKRMDERVAGALIASALLRKKKFEAMQNEDKELARNSEKKSQEFTDLGIDIMNECALQDIDRAMDLLKNSYIEFAFQNDNKMFLAQTLSKQCLQKEWVGGPPQKHAFETEKEESKISKCFWRWRLLYFLKAPAVVNLMYQVSYIGCLGYFSLYLLLGLDELESNVILTVLALGIIVEDLVPKSWSESQKSVHLHGQKMSSYQEIFNMFACPMLLTVVGNDAKIVNLYQIVYIIIRRRQMHCFAGGGWYLTSCQQYFSYNKIQYTIFDVIWKVVNFWAIYFVIIGLILRFIDPNLQRDGYFSIGLAMMYVRLLHMLSSLKCVGPKIIIFGHMVYDLVYFLTVIIVFVAAYAVSSYSLLHPKSKYSVTLLYDIWRSAYWSLYGELQLEEIEREWPNCNNDTSEYSTLPRCPSQSARTAIPLLLGGYVLICNIVLLNMLIAMFSDTYKRIIDNEDLYWWSYRYSMIKYYRNVSPLPPPANILWFIMSCIVNRCCSPSRLQTAAMDWKGLVYWENTISDRYLRRKKMEEEESLATEKRRVDISQKSMATAIARSSVLEKNLESIFNSLDMREKKPSAKRRSKKVTEDKTF